MQSKKELNPSAFFKNSNGTRKGLSHVYNRRNCAIGSLFILSQFLKQTNAFGDWWMGDDDDAGPSTNHLLERPQRGSDEMALGGAITLIFATIVFAILIFLICIECIEQNCEEESSKKDKFSKFS